MFCVDILCPVDVHETWSTLLIVVFLASSGLYGFEVEVHSVSQVAT